MLDVGERAVDSAARKIGLREEVSRTLRTGSVSPRVLAVNRTPQVLYD